jgi:adenylate kinase
MKNSKVIIVTGPPGAGKGTQAELLADKLNLYYLESSKIIESNIMQAKRDDFEIINGKKYSLTEERELWRKGILNTPEVVTIWFQRKIKELSEKNESLVIAGSPRTLYEGKVIMPLLEKLYGKKNIKVILIQVSAKETIFRNSHRKICQLMRHPILYSAETIKLKRCPLDGSKLVKRGSLDKPETIKIRLKEYKERTFPLIDYFKKEGLKVTKINGSPPPAIVFKNILKAIK